MGIHSICVQHEDLHGKLRILHPLHEVLTLEAKKGLNHEHYYPYKKVGVTRLCFVCSVNGAVVKLL